MCQPWQCPQLGSDLFSPLLADNSPAPSSSLRRPPPRPAPLSPPVLLPTLRPVPPAGPCPCLGPGHPLLLALLGLLALASLVLATLAIYLSGTWHWARWGGPWGLREGQAARPQRVPILSLQSCRASRCGRWPSGCGARKRPCGSCGQPAGSSGLASIPASSPAGIAELLPAPAWETGHDGKGHRRAGGGSWRPYHPCSPLRRGSITPWGAGGSGGNAGPHPRLQEKGTGLEGPAPAPVTALPLRNKARRHPPISLLITSCNQSLRKSPP